MAIGTAIFYLGLGCLGFMVFLALVFAAFVVWGVKHGNKNDK